MNGYRVVVGLLSQNTRYDLRRDEMCKHRRAILTGGCDVGESWQLTGGAASAAAVEETKPDTKQMLPLLQLQPLPWFSMADRTATSRTLLQSTQSLISSCEPAERWRLGSGSRWRVHLNTNRHSIKVNFNYPQQTLDFHLLLHQYKESRRLNLKIFPLCWKLSCNRS